VKALADGNIDPDEVARGIVQTAEEAELEKR